MSDLTNLKTISNITNNSFEQYSLHPELKHALSSRFSYSSLIQDQVCRSPLIDYNLQEKGKPKLNSGCIIAETGAGKTLAYLIPTLNTLLHLSNSTSIPPSPTISSHPLSLKPPTSTPNKGVLILAPNDHLLAQVHTLAEALLGSIFKYKGFSEYLFHFSAPGKLLNDKTVGNGVIMGINPQVVVFDEFDTLFTHSFKGQSLLHTLKKSETGPRQYLFAGATMPLKVHGQETRGYLKRQVKGLHFVESKNAHRISVNVDIDWVETINETEVRVFDLIDQAVLKKEKVVIFANKLKDIEQIHSVLKQEKKYEVFTEETLAQFHISKRGILVGGDKLSRGIDTYDVDHVIMYHFPKNAIDFIHKAGRTGRMGSRGKVTCFVRPGDFRLFEKIQPLVEGQDRLDATFSYKRSFGKKMRRREKVEEELEME